ncbi:MAG: C40 family peptidase [Flavobacteriaceae bacterium]|nr:MAG: C40 family peptidase [Flavobacteriaceae bacterium]
MNRKIFVFVVSILLTGCGIVKKKTTYGKERTVTVAAADKDTLNITEDIPEADVEVVVLEKADLIINTAMAYSGVRYKYGGTTKKGMDCSGLLYVSFGENDIPLPRVSFQMADEGKKIKLNKVTKGDLLFFKTAKKGKKINHVGLVVAVDGRDIKFIHATSSRGVIVSSLQEGFWNYAFVKATRVL